MESVGWQLRLWNQRLVQVDFWSFTETCGISWLAVEAAESEAGPGGILECYRLGEES